MQEMVGELMDSDLLLTLEREGEFSVRFSDSNKSQCGPTLDTDILSYRAKLTMSGAALDAQGFVVDNMFIHEYFKTTYRLVPEFESCEKIAIRACRDLKAAIGERLLGVEVMISGMQAARLTARCNFHGRSHD